MADTFSDQDKGPGGRRPAPTIEGTATEVAVEPPAHSAASPDPEPPADPEPPRHPANDHGSREPRAAPPVASPAELKGFLTHMAAGLLGGLVGVLALAFAWGGLPGQANHGASPDVSDLEQRLTKLETSKPASGDGQAVSALDQRVTSLEARAPEAPQDLSELTGRVGRLEQSMKSLAETAAKGGSVADAAAVSAQIGAAEQRLQASIDLALGEGQAANKAALGGLEREIADLQARVGALAATGPSADGANVQADVTALNARIGKLEAALPELAVAIDKGATEAKGAAVALAFASLRDAVHSGHPYAAELATLRALTPAEGALETLASHADAGIRTFADLVGSFRTASDAALAAAAPGDASLLDSLLASAQSLVKVRKIDADATGDAPAAILARAEAQLKQGDLALAVKEADTLQGIPREALAGWIDQAQARLAADDALRRLEGALLASMGGADPTPAPSPVQP